MMNAERECDDGAQTPRGYSKRPWPVVAVMLLLLGQMMGFFALLMWLSVQADGIDLARIFDLPSVTGLALQLLALTLLVGVAFLAILTILRGWQNAWHYGMLVQGLSLTFGLALYFTAVPFYTYIILAYAAFVVFYLLMPATQVAFLPVEEGKNGTS